MLPFHTDSEPRNRTPSCAEIPATGQPVNREVFPHNREGFPVTTQEPRYPLG
jgi:hypothetical protein